MPLTYVNPGALASIQIALIETLQFYLSTITTSNVSSQQSVVAAIRQTFINGLNAINAYTYQSSLAQELILLNNLNNISLGLSSEDQELVDNRLAGVQQFVNTSYNPAQLLTFNIDNLLAGQPAFIYPDYTAYLIEFGSPQLPDGIEGEPIYTFLTLDNFVDIMEEEYVAWSNVVAFLQANPTSSALTSYDAASRMMSCSADASNFVNNVLQYIDLPSSIPLNTLWNSLVALPSILRVGSLLVNNPSLLNNQIINVSKYLIITLIEEMSALLTSYISPAAAVNPSTTVLRQGESLLDVAARCYGNVEQWTTLVKLNGLVPPYVGVVRSPGVAIPGDTLYLASSGTNTSPVASYLKVFLGTDIDLGSLGQAMTNWTGDFTTIYGYNNYQSALQRRILTQLGTLIYHTTYGSGIPVEIGNVSTSSTALLLASDLKSAVLADPRTQSVSNLQAVSLGPTEIALQTTAIPKSDISGGTSLAFQINTASVPPESVSST